MVLPPLSPAVKAMLNVPLPAVISEMLGAVAEAAVDTVKVGELAPVPPAFTARTRK